MDYNKQYDPREAAAKELAYERAKANITGPGIAGRGLRDTSDVIREKGPLGKAQETLGYLNELDALQRDIRLKLYGPFPESGECGLNPPREPSLEEMLAQICQRTSMAVGDAKNLLSKLD